MTFIQKLSNAEFWKNVFKIGFPFLIMVTLFSLFMNSGKAIFSGDFNAVYETNFSNLKWMQFWLPKLVISLIYGIYTTNKNTK